MGRSSILPPTARRSEISPHTFWTIYKQEYRRLVQQSSYGQASERTKKGTRAGTSTINGLGLFAQCEYYRCDCIGYDRCTDNCVDWHLRVAFEHENRSTVRWHKDPTIRCYDWRDELCKLCFLAADLRVIVAYKDLTAEEAKDGLEFQIDLLERNGKRTSLCEGAWLIVFGPTKKEMSRPFLPFTLVKGQIAAIQEDAGDKLIPQDLQP